MSYLGGHDNAGGAGINGDVTSHQPHILELFIHLPVLLVTQSLRSPQYDSMTV